LIHFLKVHRRWIVAGEFWLSDSAWAAIGPLLPNNQPGARRVDDRRVISGIVHVLKSGCRWKDCPSVYGPSTTVYNRFNRWSWRGLWGRIFAELVAQAEIPEDLSIDSTAVRAHRSAHGGVEGENERVRWTLSPRKRGRKFKPSGARVAVRPRKYTL
jgi:transposase